MKHYILVQSIKICWLSWRSDEVGRPLFLCQNQPNQAFARTDLADPTPTDRSSGPQSHVVKKESYHRYLIYNTYLPIYLKSKQISAMVHMPYEKLTNTYPQLHTYTTTCLYALQTLNLPINISLFLRESVPFTLISCKLHAKQSLIATFAKLVIEFRPLFLHINSFLSMTN